jgi:hypothetical protein
VAVVDVAVDMETIKSSIVIVDTSMTSAMAMAMAAMIVRIMVVAVADMVVVVAKATETPREIVRTMVAAPMTLAKSVSRLVTDKGIANRAH